MSTILIDGNAVNVPSEWTTQDKADFKAAREAELVPPTTITHFNGVKQNVPPEWTSEQIEQVKADFEMVNT